jgi:hypothetical protein
MSSGIRVQRLPFLVMNLATCPASIANPAISTCPTESAASTAHCIHRGWRLECRAIPASCLASLEWGGGGLICAVIERCILPDLGGVAQLRVYVNSSCWYTVDVHKTLPPAGVNTLGDSCCISVSLKPDKLNPSQLNPAPLGGLSSTSLKQWPHASGIPSMLRTLVSTRIHEPSMTRPWLGLFEINNNPLFSLTGGGW